MNILTGNGQKITVKNIVLIGAGSFSLGAYRKIVATRKKEIDAGKLTITVVSSTLHHFNYGWIPECFSGLLPYENLLTPLQDCFEKAVVVHGAVAGLKPGGHAVLVTNQDGQVHEVPYDHLVLDNIDFQEALPSPHPPTGFAIKSALDVVSTTRQLQHLVQQAADASDELSAARVLRVVISGDGFPAIDLAAAVAGCLKKLVNQQKVVGRPTIYLVSKAGLPGNAPRHIYRLRSAITRGLTNLGVTVVTGKRVIRVNTDGAVLDDGSFIHCSLVVNAGSSSSNGLENFRSLIPGLVPTADTYGRARGTTDTWLSGALKAPAPSQYICDLQRGALAGSNIVSAIEGRRLRKTGNLPANIFGCMGLYHGFALVNGIPFSGRWGWLIRMFWLCRFTAPQNRSACLQLPLKHAFNGEYSREFVRVTHEAVRLYQFRQLQHTPT